MNKALRFRSPELDKMLHNVHFWTAIAITVFIAVIYYAWYDRYEWFWHFSIFEFRNGIIGSLFFIPFLYASLVFRWWGSLIVWSLSILAILPRIVFYSFGFLSLATNIALALVPLTVIATITLELKWRERQRQILVDREQERQLRMAQIFKAQEDERRRIAQELHDGATQDLLAVANRAQSMMSCDESETTVEVRRHAEWIRDALLHVSEDVRRLSLDLRPSILDNLGLVPALRWLTDRLYQDGKISAKLIINGAQRKLNPEIEVTIFRIVQEALSNVRCHSEATEAVITLTFSPESLQVTVRDNGKGFLLSQKVHNLAAEGRLGLIGMRQRAKSLKGTFDISSQPGQGTLVSIEIPGRSVLGEWQQGKEVNAR